MPQKYFYKIFRMDNEVDALDFAALKQKNISGKVLITEFTSKDTIAGVKYYVGYVEDLTNEEYAQAVEDENAARKKALAKQKKRDGEETEEQDKHPELPITPAPPKKPARQAVKKKTVKKKAAKKTGKKKKTAS